MTASRVRRRGVGRERGHALDALGASRELCERRETSAHCLRSACQKGRATEAAHLVGEAQRSSVMVYYTFDVLFI